jgi:phenylacetic acid degradation protein paaN
MIYFEKHKNLLIEAKNALINRNYYTPYPELPKFYGEDGDSKAMAYISSIMNENFSELMQDAEIGFAGEEISPYLQLGIGVKYPQCATTSYINLALQAWGIWKNVSVDERAGILVESLERIKLRFFDIAYATMHTTGQSFMMSFQASGPHSNDRALEAICVAHSELTKHVRETDWIKPMGKFELKIHKTWKPVPRGLSLVISCSTFPIWNTLPGVYASLMTGNPVIIKPHPRAVLPIAIVIGEIQKLFKEVGIDPKLIQLACDTLEHPITKDLASNEAVKLIDYTGGSEFGNYIESLGKMSFTEKAGVNSIILDSVNDFKSVAQNIAFSASLYTGQMCTAPQNIFIPAEGVKTHDGIISFEEAAKQLCEAISGLVDNPKAGPATLGAVQSELTLSRVKNSSSYKGKILLESKAIKNEEFPDARIATPVVIALDKLDEATYSQECFGPIVFIIKTESTADSLECARKLAATKGAITCGAYSTDIAMMDMIADTMNSVFTPVSFNFTGAAFINSHAAFSDYHVTGGNAAGNASFTNTEFISKRFVWVGNRYA